jgi:hypothetical protein
VKIETDSQSHLALDTCSLVLRTEMSQARELEDMAVLVATRNVQADTGARRSCR